MPRVKGGTTNRARHKKVLKMAKGYFGSKHRLYRTAHEQVMHSLKYAYRDRRQTKRNMRKLWITRINAACRMNDISYSKFINGLSKAEITVNRKMLSEIAIDNPKSFSDLVEISKSALAGKEVKAAPVKKEVKAEAKATPVKKEVKAEVKIAPVKKEVKTETKVKEVKKPVLDLNAKTVVELREMAKAKSVEGYSKLKKAELIEALK